MKKITIKKVMREMGKTGGLATSAKLSDKQKAERARKAAKARWARVKEKK